MNLPMLKKYMVLGLDNVVSAFFFILSQNPTLYVEKHRGKNKPKLQSFSAVTNFRSRLE
jgi:hypothetical protein